MRISREPTGINSLFLSRLAAVAVLAVGGGGLQLLGRAFFKSPASEGHSR